MVTIALNLNKGIIMDDTNYLGGDFWWIIEDSENQSGGLAVEFCIHDWVKYEGFTDAFEYCSKCDIKNR